jgi:hypothetical protein
VFIHLQFLAEYAGGRYYLGRAFEEPIGKLDPETGQPFKEYVACANLTVRDECGEIGGCVHVPDEALEAIRVQVVPALGLRELFYYRWKNGKKVRIVIPLDRKVRSIRRR